MAARRVSQATALAQIAVEVARRPGSTVWIGVDGGTGAGKSSFAARLAAELPGAVVVAIDDFAGPDIPEWDWPRFRSEVLLPLQSGRPGRYQRRIWHGADAPEWREVPAGVPVIVEGVSATRREAGVPWTVQVWVAAPRDLRTRRVLAREEPADLAQQLAGWLATEDAYVARERPEDRVDLIVEGTESC